MTKKPKVAIVHDWLIHGGAERVVYELHQLYPEAPIYTSYCTPEWRTRLDNKVVTGFLQRWPFSKLRKFLPLLRIWWFTHLDLSQYDLVISSSGNGEAFGVKTGPQTLHVNYCHSPTHYYWRHYNLYLKRPGFGPFNPLVRIGLRLLIGPLRRWDLKASQRADYFIANSEHIKADIKKYYGRDSVVIHPPVNVKRFSIAEPKKRHGLVIAGRQVPHKKFGLAIAACNRLGLDLKVVGDGPEHNRLVKMAGPTISFVTGVSDEKMPGLIASAQGFIFPSHEDFGVIPVEAMATGTPVIAYKAGGALDYMIEGQTGLFFDKQSADSIVRVLERFRGRRFEHRKMRLHAQQFDQKHFRKEISDLIDGLIRAKSY